MLRMLEFKLLKVGGHLWSVSCKKIHLFRDPMTSLSLVSSHRLCITSHPITQMNKGDTGDARIWQTSFLSWSNYHSVRKYVKRTSSWGQTLTWVHSVGHFLASVRTESHPPYHTRKKLWGGLTMRLAAGSRCIRQEKLWCEWWCKWFQKKKKSAEWVGERSQGSLERREQSEAENWISQCFIAWKLRFSREDNHRPSAPT